MAKKRKRVVSKPMLFRVVSFFSKLRFSYLYGNVRSPMALAMLFVILSGSTALAAIGYAAYRMNLPLLFPPLGPSAFIMFYTPLSASASPRNTIMGHSLAVVAGLGAGYISGLIFTSSDQQLIHEVSRGAVFSLALAAALAAFFMIMLKASHPPAVASAMLAAGGYLHDPIKAFGLVAAVILLAAVGVFFNRIVGGLPYPLWKIDPEVSHRYGVLAGIPSKGQTYWGQLSQKIFKRRR